MENNPNCLFSNFYGNYRKLFIREFLWKIPQTVYSRILMNNAANCLFSHFDGKCRKLFIREFWWIILQTVYSQTLMEKNCKLFILAFWWKMSQNVNSRVWNGGVESHGTNDATRQLLHCRLENIKLLQSRLDNLILNIFNDVYGLDKRTREMRDSSKIKKQGVKIENIIFDFVNFEFKEK